MHDNTTIYPIYTRRTDTILIAFEWIFMEKNIISREIDMLSRKISTLDFQLYTWLAETSVHSSKYHSMCRIMRVDRGFFGWVSYCIPKKQSINSGRFPPWRSIIQFQPANLKDDSSTIPKRNYQSKNHSHSTSEKWSSFLYDTPAQRQRFF